MKKNILHLYILAVVLFAASAFTSCSNNDEQASVLPVNTYTITVNATKGDDASFAPSNRALSFVGPTLTATWTKDDVVAVYKSETHLGDLTALSDGASTTLTGTLTGSVAVDDELTLKFLSPDYTPQTGTLAYIAANCDYATATVTVSSINGNNITTTPATFANQQAIVKFSLLNGTSPISASGLVVSADEETYTVTPASAQSEFYIAIPAISDKTITLTADVSGTIYTYEKADISFVNGSFYTINVKMKQGLDYATKATIGKIVGANGNIYATRGDATKANTTPAAMIAYISNPGDGLAIALSDEKDDVYFSDAMTSAAEHKTEVTGYVWKLPFRTDWEHMFTACAISGDRETSAGNWTNQGFRDKLSACKAAIQTGCTYWTRNDLNNAYTVSFSDNNACSFQPSTGEPRKVRAVLEF